MIINTVTNGTRILNLLSQARTLGIENEIVQSFEDVKENCPEFWNGSMMTYEFYDWVNHVLRNELSFSSLCNEKKQRGEEVTKEHAQNYWLMAASAKDLAACLVVCDGELVVNVLALTKQGPMAA